MSSENQRDLSSVVTDKPPVTEAINTGNELLHTSAVESVAHNSDFFRTVLSFDPTTVTGPTISSSSASGTEASAIDESEFELIEYCTLEKLSMYIGLTWHRSLIGNQRSILEQLQKSETRQRYGDIKFGQFEMWARAEAGIWIDKPPVICSKCFKEYGKFYAANTVDSGDGCRCPVSIQRRKKRERNQATFPAK
jgi:hypothetical protein